MIHENDIKNLLKAHADQISAMPDEEKARLDYTLQQLEKKKKHYYRLEEKLDEDLSVSELNTTHTNLVFLLGEITELERTLKSFFLHPGHSQDLSEAKQKTKYLTGQGAVAIRPTKKRPYNQPATRQTKSFTFNHLK